MDAKTGPEHVEGAAGDPKGNIAELIQRLKSPDRVIRAKAAAALRRLDPPAWQLIGAVFGAGDVDSQVEIMKIMRRLGRRNRAGTR